MPLLIECKHKRKIYLTVLMAAMQVLVAAHCILSLLLKGLFHFTEWFGESPKIAFSPIHFEGKVHAFGANSSICICCW